MMEKKIGEYSLDKNNYSVVVFYQIVIICEITSFQNSYSSNILSYIFILIKNKKLAFQLKNAWRLYLSMSVSKAIKIMSCLSKKLCLKKFCAGNHVHHQPPKLHYAGQFCNSVTTGNAKNIHPYKQLFLIILEEFGRENMYPYSKTHTVIRWWNYFLLENNFVSTYILLHADTLQLIEYRKITCMYGLLSLLNATATLCRCPVNLGRENLLTCSGLQLFLLINMLGLFFCCARYGLSLRTGYQYVALLLREFFPLKFVLVVTALFDLYCPTNLERGKNKKLVKNFWVVLNFQNYINLQYKSICQKKINAGSEPHQQDQEVIPEQQTRGPDLPLREEPASYLRRNRSGIIIVLIMSGNYTRIFLNYRCGEKIYANMLKYQRLKFKSLKSSGENVKVLWHFLFSHFYFHMTVSKSNPRVYLLQHRTTILQRLCCHVILIFNLRVNRMQLIISFLQRLGFNMTIINPESFMKQWAINFNRKYEKVARYFFLPLNTSEEILLTVLQKDLVTGYLTAHKYLYLVLSFLTVFFRCIFHGYFSDYNSLVILYCMPHLMTMLIYNTRFKIDKPKSGSLSHVSNFHKFFFIINSFCLIIIIIGFDINALNAALASRRTTVGYRGGALIPHHLQMNECLLTPSNPAPAADTPLINLGPAGEAPAQLPPQDEPQQDTTEVATDASTTIMDEEMTVDTTVAFFSHTTPAKLVELRRQSLVQSAFLTKNQVTQVSPRMKFNDFVHAIILRERSRIATVLNCPNNEPAERNIRENDRINGWFCLKLKVGQEGNRIDVTITLPPQRPVLMILGASHCGRMANIHVPTAMDGDTTKNNGHYLWSRTAFIRTVASAPALIPNLRELLSKVCSLCIEIYGNFCNEGTVIVMLPLSWDAVNLKISMNDYVKSLLELAHILYQFVSTVAWQQRWSLCAQFSEMPIFYRNQLRCHKVNSVVRMLNELLNPNHPPIRPWVSLSVPRARNVECSRPLHIETLSDRHLPYETMDGKHLSSFGYLIWLQVLINGAVLAVVDQSALKVEDDFRKIEVINIDVDRRLYFQTTAVTQRAVENDLLDSHLLVRLRELRHPVVDCSALESAYPEPEPEVIEVPVVAQAGAHHSRYPRVSPYDSSHRPHRSNLNGMPRNRGNFNRVPYKYRN